MTELAPQTQTAYLAAEGFVQELLAELDHVTAVHDRLVLTSAPAQPAAWAQNVWLDPVTATFESVSGAARLLKSAGRNWALYSVAHHRRGALVQQALPHFKPKPLVFPAPVPTATVGSFTLLAADTLLYAARCTSPFAHGQAAFVENQTDPPSRAYLKLWETFTLLGKRPGVGERCLDLGASPGGWTWVLAELGADVVAIDRAPLDARIASRPNVDARIGNALTLDPKSVEPMDWVFSDVICTPERLLGVVERWMASGRCKRFVCTLKFQGETDHATARRFAATRGSRLLHLSVNRHELTWILGADLPNDSLAR